MQNRTNGERRTANILSVRLLTAFCCCLMLLLTACAELEKSKSEPFYAETAPPPRKEFRWSNGKTPKSFDPARAAAPPETDLVRAVFEGLTDTNPKTLETVPAIALNWTPTNDNKVWTFKLRPDAKWSNGEQVTAKNFVSSWMRLKEMGDKVSHYKLLNNIVGMQSVKSKTIPPKESENLDLFSKQPLNQDISKLLQKQNSNTNTAVKPEDKLGISPKQIDSEKKNPAGEKIKDEDKVVEKKETKLKQELGVEAIDDYTLKVSLVNSDKDFPALAANPIFRPIYGDGKEFEDGVLNADIVTNGAFRIFSIGQDGITLDRAEYYWNSSQIELERVRFVPSENAEKALEAYRVGEVDAVTNVDFEPLALKLLTPFNDFERTTHSALNFYEFNKLNIPFQDRRVREALAISIERERLTEDDMDGASRPAYKFLPFNDDSTLKLSQNTEKAKNLLTAAGFPDGENFPPVKLFINRNNVQQRIARSVAKMWKDNLNIETEITVKDSGELDAVKNTGDFDLIRRGVVLPTTDETANMLAIFSPDPVPLENGTTVGKVKPKDISPIEKSKTDAKSLEQTDSNSQSRTAPLEDENLAVIAPDTIESGDAILTEADAIYQLPAIPLYFPTSYSLVKPYILGFEINNLDASSLKDVKIDVNWHLKTSKNLS